MKNPVYFFTQNTQITNLILDNDRLFYYDFSFFDSLISTNGKKAVIPVTDTAFLLIVVPKTILFKISLINTNLYGCISLFYPL